MRRRISKDAYRVIGYSRTDSQGEYINLALNKEGKSRRGMRNKLLFKRYSSSHLGSVSDIYFLNCCLENISQKNYTITSIDAEKGLFDRVQHHIKAQKKLGTGKLAQQERFLDQEGGFPRVRLIYFPPGVLTSAISPNKRHLGTLSEVVGDCNCILPLKEENLGKEDHI